MIRRPWLLVASLTTLSACGLSSTETVAQTADALEAAQCDLGALETAAAACRATYDACIAADGADLAACRQALHDCLPPPPDRRPRGEHGDGGDCQRGEDGGQRPPPPLDADGGRPEAHRGHGGPGRGPHPEPAEVQACRDALDACLAADPADTTCRETEHACVRAAFEAAFQAKCDEATVRCANDTSDACTRILARCAEGVSGGTCNAAVAE